MLNSVSVSPNQERYIFAELGSKHSYALPKSRLIEGPLDIQRLQSCLQRIIDAHATLRIRLHLHTLEHVTQRVHEPEQVTIDYVELPNVSHEEIHAHIASYFYAENSLFGQPLYKFQLICTGPKQHIFTYSVHHVIADGVSLQFFVDELNACWKDAHYQPIPSPDYLAVLSQHRLGQLAEEEKQTLTAFWKQYLADAAYASIPTDYSEISHDFKDNKTSLLLDTSLVSKMQILAQTNNVSVFNIVYACYLIVLSRHTGEQDICTSFQSAGRQGIPDGKHMFGLFSCALLLRQKIQKYTPVVELIQRIRQDARTCTQHQRFPYHYITKETGIHAKYAINWYPIETMLVLDDLDISAYPWGVQWSSGFDLNLHCMQETNGILLNLYYLQTVHDHNRMQTFLQQMKNVLTQILETPQRKICEINLNSEDTTCKPLSLRAKQHAHILDAFLQNASKFPDRIAIEYRDISCTYAELNLISAKLAGLLKNQGLTIGSKVAIITHRCAAMVSAMIAASRMGASFAVLDAAYPQERLDILLDIIRPDCTIACTSDVDIEALSISPGKHIQLGEQINANASIFASIDEVGARSAPLAGNPDSTAYHLFTSGTTGIPKCVAVTHSPLSHFVAWQSSHFSFSQSDRFTLISGVSHDPVLRDIFTPLSIGACILIPDRATIYEPTKLFGWLAASKATVAHLTPPMSKIIHAGLADNPPLYELRYIFTGGDMLHKSHIQNIQQFAPHARLVNFYGTTETPQAVAYHSIDYDHIDRKIPIGKAVADTQTLLLDEELHPVGLYQQGQLAIRSKYLSEGYLQPLDKPANFLNDIFSNDQDTHIYLTGDYGYYNADRLIILLGRQDDQVKIRGYRVELNEVNQAVLNLSPEIEYAITIATRPSNDSDKSHERQLVTYIVKKSGKNITINSLYSILSNKLPSYMIPSHIILIESLPLLPNGKIDRKKLPPPSSSSHIKKTNSYELPETEIEHEIALAWGKTLGNIEVGKNHSFIDLGGDSLSHIQAALALEKILGHIPDEWESKPVAELATLVRESNGWVDIDSTVLVRALSICSVVITHFFNLMIHGATSALFIVAGFTFAKYQLKTIAIRNSVKPIISTIIAIAIPASIINLTHVAYRENLYWPLLLFCDNLITADTSRWFIDVLIQILIMLTIIFSFQRIRHAAAGGYAKAFSIFMLAVSCIFALIMQQIWNTDHLHNMVPQQKLWIFIYGWFAYFFLVEQKKLAPTVLALLLPFIIEGKIDYMLTMGALMIILLPRIRIPVIFYKPMYFIAAASLMIYLTHYPIKNAFIKLGLDFHPALQVAISIIGGVLIQQAWEKARTVVKKISKN